MIDAAVFTSYAAARAAADAAMPRRKHNRPYPLSSGYDWGRAVPCPECGAAEGVDCEGRYHKAREDAARASGPAANRWIVMANSNIVMLRDGTMYDHARKVTVR
jgi:hypothetical protein